MIRKFGFTATAVTTAAGLLAGVAMLAGSGDAQAAHRRHHGYHSGHSGHQGYYLRPGSYSYRHYAWPYYAYPQTRVYYYETPTYVYTQPPTYTYVPPQTYVPQQTYAPPQTYASPQTYVPPATAYAPGTPVPYAYSDAALHAAVANFLATRFPGQIRKLKIEVEDGEVEVDGDVYSRQMKYVIERAIYTIPGVRKVDNDLHAR